MPTPERDFYAEAHSSDDHAPALPGQSGESASPPEREPQSIQQRLYRAYASWPAMLKIAAVLMAFVLASIVRDHWR